MSSSSTMRGVTDGAVEGVPAFSFFGFRCSKTRTCAVRDNSVRRSNTTLPSLIFVHVTTLPSGSTDAMVRAFFTKPSTPTWHWLSRKNVCSDTRVSRNPDSRYVNVEKVCRMETSVSTTCASCRSSTFTPAVGTVQNQTRVATAVGTNTRMHPRFPADTLTNDAA